jgi:hypothetical protein
VAAWLATREVPVAAPGDAASRLGSERETASTTRSRTNDLASTGSFDWASVATNDLRRYIVNLRAVQCPEPTVRDIIIAEVQRQFDPREAPFKVASGEVLIPENEPSAQRQTRRRADYLRRRNLRLVEKEKVAFIRDLLGVDLPLEPLRGWYSRNYERMESAINGVPAEKRERVREMMEAYWNLSDTLNDDRDVSMKGRDAEFIERYRENNERRRLGLLQILTPDEVELFDMRASSAAERLRIQLGEMQPTEAEFREIYRLRRDIEEPFGGTMTVGQTTGVEQDPQAETRYRERLEALLTPERLAQMDRVQGERHQNLARLRDRFGLAPEVVDQAYELLQQVVPITEHIRVVENGQVVDREETRQSSRPPEAQWNQIREILGSQAFTVIEAMFPDDQPEPSTTTIIIPPRTP